MKAMNGAFHNPGDTRRTLDGSRGLLVLAGKGKSPIEATSVVQSSPVAGQMEKWAVVDRVNLSTGPGRRVLGGPRFILVPMLVITWCNVMH